jgi:hypothetical protein
VVAQRNAAEIAQRDRQLAILQRQLAEGQAALERATQAAEAAERLSATDEARANELAGAGASGRNASTRAAGRTAKAATPRRQVVRAPPPPATPAGLRGAGLFARALKMTPEVRALWGAAAAAERRTLSNMFEVMVTKYCAQEGVALPPPTAAFPTNSKRGNRPFGGRASRSGKPRCV